MRPLLFIIVYFISVVISKNKNCVPKSFGYNKIVCVCNSTYCDEVYPHQPLDADDYISYTSSQLGLRFKIETGKFEDLSNPSSAITITLNSNLTYQSIYGWGGAFTDATGINIKSLPEAAQEKLLRSYFDKNGIEYNMCRVPIGGTDFSTRGYSYNDGIRDPELQNFELAPDDYLYKIPFIKMAKIINNDLKLIASAWTAPRWMKHNGMYTGPDVLRPEMYQSWANYFVKFLQWYKNDSIEFWGITTGNEPSTGLVPALINSVGWLPKQMAKFICEHLGPTLRKSEFSSIKLMTVDDQMFFFPSYIDKLYQTNNDTGKYIDGFALHWYWNKLFPHSLLTDTHNKYPTKFILATEACEGAFFLNIRVKLGDWDRAQSYAYDIIKDLKNWVTGWIDWSMALDLSGGPTYITNNVDSPILVNSGAQEFYKQPMFYALGHFSKFIPRSSLRIKVVQSSEDLDVVAFIKPNDEIVVVILNRHNWYKTVRIIKGKGKVLIKKILAKSIVTLIYPSV